jgi:WD40 repeat protein
VLQELKGGAFMYVAAFSPTDDLIAAGGGDRKVYVWNVSDGRLLHTLPHDGQVYDLDISPDGKILATALCALSNSNLDCIRGEAWLWSLPDGELIRKLQVHSDYVESIAFSPDGSLLTTGSSDRTVKFWQMPSGELQHSVSGFHGNVIEFSPAGDIFAVGGIDTVRLYALGSN